MRSVALSNNRPRSTHPQAPTCRSIAVCASVGLAPAAAGPRGGPVVAGAVPEHVRQPNGSPGRAFPKGPVMDRTIRASAAWVLGSVLLTSLGGCLFEDNGSDAGR